MTNKYLTKVALFGFSKEEKLKKLSTKHYMDTYNLYSDHFNSQIESINSRVPKTANLKSNKQDWEYYAKDIEHTMTNHKPLLDDHAKIHSEYTKKVNDLGGKTNPNYLKDFMEHHHREILSVF